MNELKQAMAKVIQSVPLSISSTRRSGQNGLRNADEVAQTILDMPEIKQALQNTVALDKPTYTPEQVQWQPIETAPEEEWVLIGTYVNNEWEFGKSIYIHETGNEMAGENYSCWFWAEDYIHLENPTHWMPLPLAPFKGA